MKTSHQFRLLLVMTLGSLAWAQGPFATRGIALSSSGGNGSVNLTFPAAVAWTATSNASWVTFTGAPSGTGSGTLNYVVSANTGVARFTTIAVAGFSFAVEQQAFSIPGLTFVGSMAHLAAQENWTSTFTMVNKSAAAVETRLSFFGDPSGLLTLPLAFPQLPASLPLLGASLDRALAANASLVIDTAGPQISPVQVGSAQL